MPVYLLTGLPMDAQSDLNIPVFIVVFLPSAESRVSVREMSTDATSSCTIKFFPVLPTNVHSDLNIPVSITLSLPTTGSRVSATRMGTEATRCCPQLCVSFGGISGLHMEQLRAQRAWPTNFFFHSDAM